ncbi:uncharacterized protein [Palaemon carinicauda]|uniref:uncharacterized protein n=1 Tax=Palaemon carinicauda TaxID=392227 RepID=UPI0035B63DEE
MFNKEATAVVGHRCWGIGVWACLADVLKYISLALISTLLVVLVSAAPQPEDGLNTEPREEQKGEQDQKGEQVEIEEDQEAEKEETTQRDDKVFIALIQVPQDECVTTDSESGTCMPSYECTRRGGVAAGSCAKNFGTCCLIERTCGTETTLNNTYFVNPAPGSADDTLGKCSLTINRVSGSICQIRLDFKTFSLSQPDTDGECADNSFTATHVNTAPPRICGDNTGQHMYLDVEPNGGAIELAVDRSTTKSSRTWNIKVTQISCDSKYRAPPGCLQYYTSTSGIVKSFNYKNYQGSGEPANRQIKNQNYGVCIKKAPEYCGVIWSRDTATKYSFTVSGDSSAIFPDLIGTPSASSNGTVECTDDYVIIPKGKTDTSEEVDRLCGLGFPTKVTSTGMPFTMTVVTNGDENVDGANLGFKLNYRQTRDCT